MTLLTYNNTPPDAAAFAEFRAACGWGRVSEALAQKAIDNSLVFISAHKGEQLVGFGRVVGDGALNVYIQDLIIGETMRGEGIGKAILGKLLNEIGEICPEDVTIGLMSATGKEQFYEHFGFQKRPSHIYGAGMTLILGAEGEN